MEPGTILAVVDLSATVLGKIGKYYLEVKDAQDEIAHLRREVEEAQKTTQQLLELSKRVPALGSLSSPIQKVQKDLSELDKKLDPGKRHRMMSKVNLKALAWPLKKGEAQNYILRLERFKTAATVSLELNQTNMLADTKQDVEKGEIDRQLAKLPIAEGAAFDSFRLQHESKCLPNTRTDLLQQIESWSTKKERHIFWLSGVAGSGKSTIARTVAEIFAKSKCLAGSFFLSRGGGDLGHAGKFVTTLARQIASIHPSLRSHICHALSTQDDLPRQGLRLQWKTLILDAISNSASSLSGNSRFVFLIDALDECDGEEDVRLILQLLLELERVPFINVRVFLTSRPETPIRLGFMGMPAIVHQDLKLGDIPNSTVEHDLKIYLETELGRISSEHQLNDWPQTADISALVKRCNALFIYAATVIRFVGDSDDLPKERLEIVLQSKDSQPDLHELDKMYTQVLEHSVLKNRSGIALDRIVSQFQRVIGCFVLLLDVLPIKALSLLLELPLGNVQTSFKPLHSLVYIPEGPDEALRALHPSFRDFLLDKRRCLNRDLQIKVEDTHVLLSMNCLRVLSAHLRKDICNLHEPGALAADVDPHVVELCLPSHIRYACRYWVEHLGQISPSRHREVGLTDGGRVHQFLKEKFLHWLEAMSWLRWTSESVLIMLKLKTLILVSESPELQSLINDAVRFVKAHLQTIEIAPLQVYLSALIFSPTNSLVKKQYIFHLNEYLAAFDCTLDNWDAVSQTIPADANVRPRLLLSNDGKELVSSTQEGLQIWDTTTGSLQDQLKFPANHICDYLILNPGGQLLGYFLLPYADEEPLMIQVWNLATRTLLKTRDLTPLALGKFTSMAFTEDNDVLVASGDDQGFTVTNLSQGSSKCLKSHSNSSKKKWIDAKLSPRCNWLLTLSWRAQEKLTTLWNLKEGTNQWRLPETAIVETQFSSDERFLLTLSEEGQLVLWRTVSGKVWQHTIEEPSDGRYWSLAFSADAALFAAAGPWVIMIWNRATEIIKLQQTLVGTSQYALDLAFSPLGNYLATRSGESIKIWDMESGTDRSFLRAESHTNEIESVGFSTGHNLVASSSSDKQIKLWTLTDDGLQLLQSHQHHTNVDRLHFSPNGTLLFGPANCEASFWKVTANSLELCFQCDQLPSEFSTSTSASFLPDNTLLALCCTMDEDYVAELVKVWNETSKRTFDHDMQSALSGTSLDEIAEPIAEGFGRSMYSYRQHKPVSSLFVLDLHTWRLRHVFSTKRNTKAWRLPITISPDNQLLALLDSYATEIKLIDVQSGQLQKTVQFGGPVRKIAPSKDGTGIETDLGTASTRVNETDVLPLDCQDRVELSVRDKWVYRGQKRSVFLPPDYRRSWPYNPKWAAGGNKLILGSTFGALAYLHFKEP